MSFLGLEKPIEYSGVLVFDPTMAKMVLDAQDKYFNAVYADYQQGLQDMKEFKKEYGDFITPILADLEWYNNNVIGKVRNFINDAYARGIDLTRSAEGRAAIAQMINSIDVGSVNKLRSSAENAREFLKERSRLEAQGLYNPLLAKYEGFDPNTYSTLDRLDTEGNIIAGRGIWDKMSPTRITDMATFGNPYFEGMKPNIHKESKNGIEYSIESINENDLKNIAEAHFNELVSTPQGQLMFKYYRDLAGGDANPQANEKAREMFNNAVVDGQRRRIYTKDDYNDQWDKHQQIAQGWKRIAQADAELQLKRDEFEWQKDYYGGGSSSSSSSGGSGSGSDNLPTRGTSTMVSADQDKQYMEIREDFENKLKTAEASAFSKLDGDLKLRIGDKARADRYKRADAVLNDPKSSKLDKKAAKETIEKMEKNPSENMKQWIKAYKESTDKTAWDKYRSSTGINTPWGQEQSELTLMGKAHEAFYRLNILSNPLDIGARADMNHALGIIEDEEGKKIGTVTRGTEFAPIAEAAFTGNRVYRHDSKVNKLNRLLKGKHYTVTAETESGREYGSGVIKDTKYNVITQNVIFHDNDVVNELATWSPLDKKQAGIVSVDNGTGYIIPIITKYSTGSYTHANINSETDERYKSSEVVKQRPSRLAEYLMKPIQ